MNIASLELCKELYELSGWDNKASTASRDRLRVWMQDYSTSDMGPAHDDYETTPPEERNKVHIYDWKVTDDPRRRVTTGQELFKWWYSQVKTIENNVVPAYDLGYLLRRLKLFELSDWEGGMYRITYTTLVPHVTTEHIADTPEDAAAKLAIELFKQGVLKRGE